jgi:hypothetical protein
MGVMEHVFFNDNCTCYYLQKMIELSGLVYYFIILGEYCVLTMHTCTSSLSCMDVVVKLHYSNSTLHI